MLQNRVDPCGNIIKTPARGAWLGNRGQLHNNGKTILRPFKHQAWIICLLQFKGRQRAIMSPGLWTELFFLDEATAFSAGHRPCFECRREDATRFKQAWLAGNPQYSFNIKTSIGEIDKILQQERIDAQGQKVTFEATVNDLPNGVFIQLNDKPYLLNHHRLYQWSPSGYSAGELLPDGDILTVLTPRSIVNAFGAGYQPQISVTS
ncbi:hypothetical protein [Mucilaginibacter sp. FT3.2]|uniref:hypothetical protein n=1 Tax=Mucilaginibacter sp. FT3.2 TaxID=2723090 RepID=UPI00161A8DDF|nr:hypothetical protein [Mucilaginibacter sp. FT3.2]MBB6230384.1 hypothetical protein [Mucilaginibacter sp. FT3.2]